MSATVAVGLGVPHQLISDDGLCHIVEHLVAHGPESRGHRYLLPNLVDHGLLDGFVGLVFRHFTSYVALGPDENMAYVEELLEATLTDLRATQADIEVESGCDGRTGTIGDELKLRSSWLRTLASDLVSGIYAGTPLTYDPGGHPDKVAGNNPDAIEQFVRQRHRPETWARVTVDAAGPTRVQATPIGPHIRPRVLRTYRFDEREGVLGLAWAVEPQKSRTACLMAARLLCRHLRARALGNDLAAIGCKPAALPFVDGTTPAPLVLAFVAAPSTSDPAGLADELFQLVHRGIPPEVDPLPYLDGVEPVAGRSVEMNRAVAALAHLTSFDANDLVDHHPALLAAEAARVLAISTDPGGRLSQTVAEHAEREADRGAGLAGQHERAAQATERVERADGCSGSAAGKPASWSIRAPRSGPKGGRVEVIDLDSASIPTSYGRNVGPPRLSVRYYGVGLPAINGRAPRARLGYGTVARSPQPLPFLELLLTGDASDVGMLDRMWSDLTRSLEPARADDELTLRAAEVNLAVHQPSDRPLSPVWSAAVSGTWADVDVRRVLRSASVALPRLVSDVGASCETAVGYGPSAPKGPGTILGASVLAVAPVVLSVEDGEAPWPAVAGTVRQVLRDHGRYGVGCEVIPDWWVAVISLRSSHQRMADWQLMRSALLMRPRRAHLPPTATYRQPDDLAWLHRSARGELNTRPNDLRVAPPSWRVFLGLGNPAAPPQEDRRS